MSSSPGTGTALIFSLMAASSRERVTLLGSKRFWQPWQPCVMAEWPEHKGGAIFSSIVSLTLFMMASQSTAVSKERCPVYCWPSSCMSVSRSPHSLSFTQSDWSRAGSTQNSAGYSDVTTFSSIPRKPDIQILSVSRDLEMRRLGLWGRAKWSTGRANILDSLSEARISMSPPVKSRRERSRPTSRATISCSSGGQRRSWPIVATEPPCVT